MHPPILPHRHAIPAGPLAASAGAGVHVAAMAGLVLVLWGPAGTAEAQTIRPQPAPATRLAANDAVPQSSTATFGTWTVRCQQVTYGTPPAPRKLCEVAQSVLDQRQQPILQVAIGQRPVGGDAGKRILLVQLPVNIRVALPVRLVVVDGAAFPLTLQHCVPAGCFADTEVTDALLAALRARPDGKAQIEFTDAARNPIKVPLDLVGFNAAWTAYAADAGR